MSALEPASAPAITAEKSQYGQGIPDKAKAFVRIR
jgi:hypothetical protein